MTFNEESEDGSHARLGWVKEEAEIDGPVGYDNFGWSYRDIGGSKVTQSMRYKYGQPFGPGDVIGLAIYVRKTKTSRFTTIGFYKNGIDQGIAFDFSEDVGDDEDYAEVYFPAASLYGNASISFNPGPTFQFPPSHGKWRFLPISSLKPPI